MSGADRRAGGSDAVTAFADRLRQLKERTPHSYASLSARAGVSRSALHRYCSGHAVPARFAVVERLGRWCGADRAELLDLHRLWVLARDARARETAAPPDAAAPTTSGRRGAPGRPARRPRRHARPVRLLAVALSTTALWTLPADTPAPGRGLLFTEQCAAPVGMGSPSVCVREVQRLLAAAGAEISAGGRFDALTLRRVTAYQALAGLPLTSVAGLETKRALYAGGVRLPTWEEEWIVARIRSTFRQEPKRAEAVARCRSRLDPLHVLPLPDGSRVWGLFELSDRELSALSAGPRQALDPAWNISAAYRLSRVDDGFLRERHCLAAPGDGPQAAELRVQNWL